MALSFATDIKPMFTALDQDHMSFMFDLWDYDDVKTNASQILAAVQKGTMPPTDSGESRWTTAMVSKFQQWINEGCPP